MTNLFGQRFPILRGYRLMLAQTFLNLVLIGLCGVQVVPSDHEPLVSHDVGQCSDICHENLNYSSPTPSTGPTYISATAAVRGIR